MNSNFKPVFLKDGDEFDTTTTFLVPEFHFSTFPQISNPWMAGYPAEAKALSNGTIPSSKWEREGYYQVGQKGLLPVK